MTLPSMDSTWGLHWRSSAWFIVTAIIIALFTDTFLNSFIVPILPYMIEDRISLDPSRTQSIITWLFFESAAVSLLLRMPLAHFADKSTSKRKWFMWALVIALTSTIATAASSSLAVLFVSRFVQAFANSIMWVVGYSTLAATVPIQHTAKVYSVVSVASSLGASSGPMLAGMLFQLAGYWMAWTLAFAIIAVDIIFRLLMVEKPTVEEPVTVPAVDPVVKQDSPSEHSPLLSSRRYSNSYDTTTPQKHPQPAPNFYKCLFGKRNYTAGLWCAFIFGIIFTAFNATVPLHVRDKFQWGGMKSGLIFAALQFPRLLMSPFVGWLKDRIGTRIPTVYGFAALTPLLWLLGIPGSGLYQWADTKDRGPALYVLTMILIGMNTSFLNGAGSIEATIAANELENEYPGAFGPGGGKARAIALSGVSFILGSCVGPVLAGVLNQEFGYYTMNCVIASLSALSAIVAYTSLPKRRSTNA
ncbi:uncharacterized protein N7511_006773 [Penicillium nucicola]|uniref:uncharacterized protein n=1 Tax=Penicillium nucicola TaxID=1850975 RepID=UPI002544EFC7|nr:uncharacterized protein N7511_006773 [Penicillium nucicola]KAJ5758079.1 hypothetical protein N7511_006773 [Penicillium nucicola]